MSTHTVSVSQLSWHLGAYIEFEFHFGWGDSQKMRGYLHGISNMDAYSVYLHVSNEPVLPEGADPMSIGGYAMAEDEKVTVFSEPNHVHKKTRKV